MSGQNERFEAYLKKHRKDAPAAEQSGPQQTPSKSTSMSLGLGPDKENFELFTHNEAIEEAFTYSSETLAFDETGAPLDLQKALKSVAFLLEWASDSGNDPIEGMEALAFARLLQRGAKDVAQIDTFYKNRLADLKSRTD